MGRSSPITQAPHPHRASPLTSLGEAKWVGLSAPEFPSTQTPPPKTGFELQATQKRGGIVRVSACWRLWRSSRAGCLRQCWGCRKGYGVQQVRGESALYVGGGGGCAQNSQADGRGPVPGRQARVCGTQVGLLGTPPKAQDRPAAGLLHEKEKKISAQN